MSDETKDIVTQLRRGCDRNDRQDYDRFYNLAEEAADEIARLRQLLLTALALHGGVAHTYGEINWRCDARNALGIPQL